MQHHTIKGEDESADRWRATLQHHAVKQEEPSTWDVESMFDPPKHAFGRGNVNANVPGRSPPSFLKRKAVGELKKASTFSRPFKSDDGNDTLKNYQKDDAGTSPSAAAAAPAIEEVFPIKFSLSHEYRDDASFSEYIKDSFSSPRGSPIGHGMSSPAMYPSPLNVERSDTLDFGISGFSMPKLEMSPMSAPPRSANNGDSPNAHLAYARLKSPPSIKKDLNDHAFVNDHSNHSSGNGTSDLIENYTPDRRSAREDGNAHHPVITPIHAGGPTQHLSPGQTIYNVASKSLASPLSPYQPYPWRPSSHHSRHSTPLNSSQGAGNTKSSPEFLPPRGSLREPSRSVRETTITATASKHDCGANEAVLKPMQYDPITPSPSHIRQAVSDETVSPLAPTVHHPPQRPAASASSLGWSESLHRAPLPPYEQPRQAAWNTQNLPPALPSASSGYPHASTPYFPPYYQQHHQAYQQPAVPDRATSNATPASRVDDPRTAIEAADWHKHHHLLHQFLLRFGHCNVPQGYGVGTHYEGLYQWCVNQRTEYQNMCRGDGGDVGSSEKCTMTPTRVQVLTSMGFVWGRPPAAFRLTTATSVSGNVPAASKSYSSWNRWIELLTEYKNEYGNVDVPLKYEPNPSLGTFVNRQRTEYRKMQNGKPSSMTQQRVDELSRLSFTWAIRDSHTSWEDRFNELKEFYNANGHSNVPKIYAKNPSLGYWVNEQRFQYRRMLKKKSNYVTDDKIQALSELDFKVSNVRAIDSLNYCWIRFIKFHGNFSSIFLLSAVVTPRNERFLGQLA